MHNLLLFPSWLQTNSFFYLHLLVLPATYFLLFVFSALLFQGAIVTSLRNHFKEFRRTPVERGKLKTNTKKSPKKKSPGITQSLAQPLPAPGEDSVSFERHCRLLQVEFTKARRNQHVVTDLMDRTFAMRRREILEEPHDLDGLFEQFPFHQQSDQVWMCICISVTFI